MRQTRAMRQPVEREFTFVGRERWLLSAEGTEMT